MLDPGGRFVVTELPHVAIYPDHAAPTRFYAVPTTPRVALDERGMELISLLIYGVRDGADVRPHGGQFTVTTTLALTTEEGTLLRNALQHRLGLLALASGRTDVPPEPDILSPDWLDGQVTVRLTDQFQLTGTPSLVGANTCALGLTLNANEAQELREAWNAGLPDAWIRYRVHVRAAAVSRAGTNVDETEEVAYRDWSLREVRKTHADVDIVQAIRQPLVVEGGLPLTAEQLKRRLQIVRI